MGGCASDSLGSAQAAPALGSRRGANITGRRGGNRKRHRKGGRAMKSDVNHSRVLNTGPQLGWMRTDQEGIVLFVEEVSESPVNSRHRPRVEYRPRVDTPEGGQRQICTPLPSDVAKVSHPLQLPVSFGTGEAIVLGGETWQPNVGRQKKRKFVAESPVEPKPPISPTQGDGHEAFRKRYLRHLSVKETEWGGRARGRRRYKKGSAMISLDDDLDMTEFWNTIGTLKERVTPPYSSGLNKPSSILSPINRTSPIAENQETSSASSSDGSGDTTLAISPLSLKINRQIDFPSIPINL